MKIHEYQAKEILSKYGVPCQLGVIVSDKSAIESSVEDAQKRYGNDSLIVKAQIHAGGRGKGGGVKYATDKNDAIEKAQAILGMTLVTPQTGKSGRLVKKIMLAKAFDIKCEYYLAITLDRSNGQNAIICSKEGGMDIEKVAEENPAAIYKVLLNPTQPHLPLHILINVATALGIEYKTDLFGQMAKIVQCLYQAYLETDASLIEINPLVITEDEQLVALDAKFNFDDNALFRQKEYINMRDLDEEEESEIEARKHNLNFIKLDGNVGCMVNGAGLAMATMDIIKQMGGEPANFLDVGGTASVETVKEAFRIILSDKSVKVILVNIFGGIVRCDRVAGGIIGAVKELGLTTPVVARLEGTNSEEAAQMIADAKLSLYTATGFAEAAKKAVELGNK